MFEEMTPAPHWGSWFVWRLHSATYSTLIAVMLSHANQPNPKITEGSIHSMTTIAPTSFIQPIMHYPESPTICYQRQNLLFNQVTFRLASPKVIDSHSSSKNFLSQPLSKPTMSMPSLPPTNRCIGLNSYFPILANQSLTSTNLSPMFYMHPSNSQENKLLKESKPLRQSQPLQLPNHSISKWI